MKVEMLKTLKGSAIWRKGTVFDDIVSPIPGDILKEVDSGSSAVKMTATEKPIVAVETENEIEETVSESVFKDLPVTADEAERIQKVFETVARAQEEKSIAPPETEESFKCNKCRFVGKTEAALKRHNTMNHKV